MTLVNCGRETVAERMLRAGDNGVQETSGNFRASVQSINFPTAYGVILAYVSIHMKYLLVPY